MEECANKLKIAYDLLQNIQIQCTLGNLSNMLAAQKHMQDVYEFLKREAKKREDGHTAE